MLEFESKIRRLEELGFLLYTLDTSKEPSEYTKAAIHHNKQRLIEAFQPPKGIRERGYEDGTALFFAMERAPMFPKDYGMLCVWFHNDPEDRMWVKETEFPDLTSEGFIDYAPRAKSE